MLDQLLEKGYRVRGTVRSQAKVDQIRQKYPNSEDKLELCIVEDIQVKGAFDSLLDGTYSLWLRLTVDIDGICHVASPFHFKPKDNEKDLLLPAINGTINLLSSALNAPYLKRIIITSSMATISHIGKGVWPGKVYNVLSSSDFPDHRKMITTRPLGRNALEIQMLISCIRQGKRLRSGRHGNLSRHINPSGTS